MLKIEHAKADTLGTVTRALRILDYLADRPHRGGVREIAAHFDLNISTAYHVINTLWAEGYIEREPGGKFTLGHKITRLSRAFSEGPHRV